MCYFAFIYSYFLDYEVNLEIFYSWGKGKTFFYDSKIQHRNLLLIVNFGKNAIASNLTNLFLNMGHNFFKFLYVLLKDKSKLYNLAWLALKSSMASFQL